ncbi:MAG: PEP-CTERM sorting domain-containing protein [Limisphaerales bacterium]
MKKLVLTTVCAMAMAGAAFAQGTLVWNTLSPAGITAQYNANYSPLFGGPGGGTGTAMGTANGGFYFELLYNTAFTGTKIAQPSSVAALTGSWIDTGLEAANASASAGKLIPLASNGGAVVPGWVGGIGTQGGTTNNIVLVGWSSNLGTSWTAVSSLLLNWATEAQTVSGTAYFGESNVGFLVPNTGTTGATVFAAASGLNGTPILSLNTQLYALPVPEPATFALAGLGGLSLLLFRRRK